MAKFREFRMHRGMHNPIATSRIFLENELKMPLPIGLEGDKL